jgi:hypothetical protein
MWLAANVEGQFTQRVPCSSPCNCTGACFRRAEQPNVYNMPSVQEQMGTDPQSKLAAAINRLCDLIEKSE